MYFSAEPPFGTGRRRKSEFPDAYALLTLEARAAAARSHCFASSADKGWAAVRGSSDHLVCVTETEVLALFIAADPPEAGVKEPGGCAKGTSGPCP